MIRRYVEVCERRLPWSLFPKPERLSLEQKIHVMAAYKRYLNVCRYRKARTSFAFTEWSPGVVLSKTTRGKRAQLVLSENSNTIHSSETNLAAKRSRTAIAQTDMSDQMMDMDDKSFITSTTENIVEIPQDDMVGMTTRNKLKKIKLSQ